MTNKELLIESMMSEMKREVEKLVAGMSPENDVLDDVEKTARAFAHRCGGIVFKAHINACLEAQNYGYVGDKIDVAGGGTAYFERYEERWVLSHLGRYRIRRAYYWDRGGQSGTIPLDDQWGLDEREPSPSLRKSIGMLSAELPFARGRRLMQQLAQLDLPEKRLQESGEALGEKIREANEAEAEAALAMLRDANVGIAIAMPSARSGTLYIQMDGGRINTTTEGWREPKVGTLYWGEDVIEISKDRRLVLDKEYMAVLGDADELAQRLWAAACRWQWWKAERVVVLGDGASWIWNRASELFPDATQTFLPTKAVARAASHPLRMLGHRWNRARRMRR